MYRLCQGALGGPAEPYSSVQDVYRKPNGPRPFTNGQGLPVPSDPSSRTLVVGLVDLGGPIAVVRRIAKTVVASLYGVLWRRPRPHVAVEGFKGSQPLRTDGDSSPAVVWKRFARCLVTSFSHSAPDHVFGHAAQAVRVIFGAWTCRALSARAGLASGEIGQIEASNGAAFAPAFQISMARLMCRWSNEAEHSPCIVSRARLRGGILHSCGLILPLTEAS